MVTARRVLIAVAVVAIAAGMGTTYALHDGGVAHCNACHQMHDAPGADLLLGSDSSSACLNCHEDLSLTGPSSYHMSTSVTAVGSPPTQLTPGGDFGWLNKTYSYQAWPGAPTTVELGESHGHNIEALDFGYNAETGTSPGGTFDSTELTCASCHDPHGKWRWKDDNTVSNTGAPIVGSGSYDTSGVPPAGAALGTYRLLAGAGYEPYSGYTYTDQPPVAFAPSTYNRSEDTQMTRVAYGSGMSEWCANCHADMHDTVGVIKHPAGNFANMSSGTGTTVADVYDQYRGSGNLTGTNADSFLSLVPFEEQVGYAGAVGLQDNATPHRLPGFPPTYGPTFGEGPDGTDDNVMCLSCHRAHASGWQYGMRWNDQVTFIIWNSQWPGTDHPDGTGVEEGQGRTQAETLAAMYEIPAAGITGTGAQFAAYQRSLCNKCHAQD